MLPKSLLKELRELLGNERVSVGPETLERFAWDALRPGRAMPRSIVLNSRPDVVATPLSTKDVAAVLALAHREGIPVVPYGGGTGVMGAALSLKGGILLNLQAMNKIVRIEVEDETAVVQPGVLLEVLNAALEEQGLMLGHDPWSLPIATVGGAISTNGVGYLAGKYGPMGDQVLGLEIVLPDGSVVCTRTVPKVAGVNLVPLFVGAEGTLGVITQVTLRAFPLPEERRLWAIRFAGFPAGFRALQEMRKAGLRPSLVDYAEEDFPPPSEAKERWQEIEMPSTLYLGMEGCSEEVEASAARTLRICRRHGGEVLEDSEATSFWEHRHDSALRWQDRARRGAAGWSSAPSPWSRMEYLHVALPVSRVLEYRRQCLRLFAEADTFVRECSLWGRPELFSILVSLPEGADQGEMDTMVDAVETALALAQDVGGSMEYCHGVGVRLAHLMQRELGSEAILWRRIKQALDPHGIMNPGKLPI